MSEAPGDKAAMGAGAFPLLAWVAHLVTAFGAVLAFLALQAISEAEWELALAWLVLALVIDDVDGSIARAAKVSERLERIDGPSLDLIIDYLNYVFVPTIFIVQAGLVPEAWSLPLAAAILVSALYNFVRRDMKTEDNYFRGFPALWNVVALYLYIVRPEPTLSAAIIAFLAFLTFAPVHFIHPLRVRDFQPGLALLAAAWAAATLALLWPNWDGAVRGLLMGTTVATAILLVLAGFWRTLRSGR